MNVKEGENFRIGKWDIDLVNIEWWRRVKLGEDIGFVYENIIGDF